MALPVETLESLLRLQAEKLAELEAAGLSRAATVSAEAAIEADIRAAMAGDAAALAKLAAPVERPAPDAAEAAWRASGLPPAGEGDPSAVEAASEPETAPAPRSRPARSQAASAASVPAIERPGVLAPARRASATDPAGFLAVAGGFIDRRRAGFLCEAVDEIAVPEAGVRFYRSSHDNYQASIRAFLDLAGNRPIRAYTRTDIRDFLVLLARVPTLRPRSDRMTLRQSIEEADRRERAAIVEAKGSGASPGAIQAAIEAAKVERLKLRTLDRIRGNLGQVFAWAVVSGAIPENPFDGAGMSRKAKAAKRASEPGVARRPWTPDEVRVLLADRPDDPAVFWAPRLALGFGGGRLEEVLSRRGSDFRDAGDGGWLVSLPPKTTQSPRREVPVHSALIEAGLLDLVAAAGAGFLFDALPVDRKGRRAGSFSRDWGRYRKGLGLTARGLDFHGLRSTANAAMEAVGPDDSPGASLTIRQAVLGHRSPALADSDYLRGGPAWRGRRLAVERIPLRAWLGAA